MARVLGPLHSDAASGTLAQALTFGATRGKAWVRPHRKKVQRTSYPAKLADWIMGACSYGWAHLTPEQQDAWEEYARWLDQLFPRYPGDPQLTAYHRYVQENYGRILRGEPPLDWPPYTPGH